MRIGAQSLLRRNDDNKEGRQKMRIQNLRKALLAVAAAALMTLPGEAVAEPEVSADGNGAPSVTVEVKNNNWLDVRVYAVSQSGAYDRLGTVTSMTSQKFKLPSWVTASAHEVTLIAVTIGGNRRVVTDPILVSSGDVVVWRVENNIALSSVSVRVGA
jgi:hypothetical protein